MLTKLTCVTQGHVSITQTAVGLSGVLGVRVQSLVVWAFNIDTGYAITLSRQVKVRYVQATLVRLHYAMRVLVLTMIQEMVVGQSGYLGATAQLRVERELYIDKERVILLYHLVLGKRAQEIPMKLIYAYSMLV